MKIKTALLLPFILMALYVIMSTSSCKAGGNKKGDIKVGSSCEGIGAMAARIVCVDNKILFCSSVTGYQFNIQTECKPDQLCEVAADGKSASCKPR